MGKAGWCHWVQLPPNQQGKPETIQPRLTHQLDPCRPLLVIIFLLLFDFIYIYIFYKKPMMVLSIFLLHVPILIIIISSLLGREVSTWCPFLHLTADLKRTS